MMLTQAACRNLVDGLGAGVSIRVYGVEATGGSFKSLKKSLSVEMTSRFGGVGSGGLFAFIGRTQVAGGDGVADDRRRHGSSLAPQAGGAAVS